MKGYYLQRHVFKSIVVQKESACDAKCYIEGNCVSYNIVSSLEDGTLTCELSDSDHEIHPEELVRRFGSTYHPFEVSSLERNPFSCPGAMIILVSTRNRDLWPNRIFWACAEGSCCILSQSDLPDLTMRP